MKKSYIGFKQIRKKATKPPYQPNKQNPSTYLSPNVSFTNIIKHHDIPLIQINRNPLNTLSKSPIKFPTSRSKHHNTSGDKDCNKFYILLKSKGYNHANSDKKKHQQISFRTISNSSKYRISTDKCQINTDRFMPQPKNQQDLDSQQPNNISKYFISSRQKHNDSNSITKLKHQLISPITKKKQNQAYSVILNNNTTNALYDQSIRSQDDLVNMSKNNQSIGFDMSPCL